MSQSPEREHRDRDRDRDRDRGDRDEERPDRGRRSGTSLLIRNLSYDVNRHDLLELFEKYNAIDAHVPLDYHTRNPRGFGFVEFSVRDDAMAALDRLDGTLLKGRELRMMEAKGNRKSADEMRANDRGYRRERFDDRHERRGRYEDRHERRYDDRRYDDRRHRDRYDDRDRRDRYDDRRDRDRDRHDDRDRERRTSRSPRRRDDSPRAENGHSNGHRHERSSSR